jgi:hypothetical protein
MERYTADHAHGLQHVLAANLMRDGCVRVVLEPGDSTRYDLWLSMDRDGAWGWEVLLAWPEARSCVTLTVAQAMLLTAEWLAERLGVTVPSASVVADLLDGTLDVLAGAKARLDLAQETVDGAAS